MKTLMVQFDPSNPEDRDHVRRILEAFDQEPLTPAEISAELAKRHEQERVSGLTRAIVTGARDQVVEAIRSNGPPTMETLFIRFWKVVHAKIKRAVAEKAFQKAVDRVADEHEMTREEAAEFITERMEAYAASPAGSPTDRTPTHPSTWLNGGQYEDDPRTWEQENGTPAPRRLDL